ncbi:MAG: 1,4-alpha-glucan branching protein GlgB [Clostridia bacterium]|nr:1,4-alpha-glucan branching protein GlgB [Clostridia bacterium]
MKENNDLAKYLFCQGTNFHAYEWLGGHSEKPSDGYSYIFRVWAPKADAIFIVGDFNGWRENMPMEKDAESGVWSYRLNTADSIEGQRYKYKVVSKTRTSMKADPYAFYNQTLTETASMIHTLGGEWHDGEWMKKRKKPFEDTEHFYPAPMNIYEVHLGSWKRKDGRYLSYRELADELSQYVKDMGYTHIELMPISEYPFDGSWGYQVCGYYSPTSRFGTPEDFKYFIDKMHGANIGVILDWVPAHFSKDEHGLIEFDGYPLYEYQDKNRMEHKNWGTRCFDVGRPEVQSFLISNALFWFREYHMDGLRIDAVASMLYLDFDRAPGEWTPNVYGDNKSLEAIAFFRKLNTAVFGEFPDALMIAEESTSWDKLTKPVYSGGLGFNFKWNMGWANDMFEYLKTDPLYRRYVHGKLTFPLVYAFSENYILPVSHDEVVHCKKSLLDKCFGPYDEKFSCMRAFLVYMMTLPGKKLLFMGSEYAPFREWNYEDQLEWFMLGYEKHSQMRDYVKALNHVYIDNRPLWDIDDGWAGFEWINPNDADGNTISYFRRSRYGEELMIVINFSPAEHRGYVLRVPSKAEYEKVFDSGIGYGVFDKKLKTKAHREDGRWVHEITCDIPSYGAVIYRKKG